MYKLILSEIPSVISFFALDLENLLDQTVSITKLKRSFASLFEEKSDTFSLV